MLDRGIILETISPLPPELRKRILDNLLRRMEEAKDAEKSQTQIEREVVGVLLDELFANLVQPIEMLDKTLASKTLRSISSFKIEFSELLFDRRFLEKTMGFREEFLSLVEELGFSQIILSKKNQLDWKGQSAER
jgi:hypothetical protein